MESTTTPYIDGFIFPIAVKHIDYYKSIAKQVAAIWKDYGALTYYECVRDEVYIEGTVSFTDVIPVKEGENIIFGWMTFPSKKVRDEVHKKVASDPKMLALVAPLMDSKDPIFDASRMVYGGFNPLVIE